MKIYYVEGNTFFHKADPISKFIWAILVALILVSEANIQHVLITSIIVYGIAMIGARIPLLSYAKFVLLLMFGGVWLIMFQGWVRPGPGVELLGIHLSRFGMEIGFAILLRTFGLVAAALAFSVTTSPKQLSLAMIKIGMPYKFAHVAYMALRFIPMFESDLRILLDAQKLRGIRPGKDKLVRAIRAMLITELRRVDITAIALETRAFGLYGDKTFLETTNVNARGIFLLVFTIILIAIGIFVFK